MDLLQALGVDSLPEEQTRAAHLSETLAKDPDLRVGFNCCCACGSKFKSDNGKDTVECRKCRRVRYCSVQCRDKDSKPGGSMESNEEGDEQSLGHSSLICSLLRCCQEDEDAEDPKTACRAPEAAHDRVRSELESYPTTLANIMLECPCFDDVFSSIGKKPRELIIHVVGVSEDAELWGKRNKRALKAYSEALVPLAEERKISRVLLRLIGPECPVLRTEDRTVPLDKNESKSYRFVTSTHRDIYNQELLQRMGNEKPNFVVFFNPGFTCPDYDWKSTVACLRGFRDEGPAFIMTTNTEMECIADCQFLHERKLMPALPPIVAEIVGEEGDGSDEGGEAVIFAENPYAGNRVRQSGTMANDLFVKNRWMLCGIFSKSSSRQKLSSQNGSKRRNPDLLDDEEKYHKKRKAPSNNKRTNPALV